MFIFYGATDFSHLSQERKFRNVNKQNGPSTEAIKHVSCYRASWSSRQVCLIADARHEQAVGAAVYIFCLQIRSVLSRPCGKNPASYKHSVSASSNHTPPPLTPNNRTFLRPKKQLTGMMTKVMVSFLCFISSPYVS